jgi:hypothetical protein
VSFLRRLVACAALVAACAAPPTPPPGPTTPPGPPRALLVQAGDAGRETLTVIDVPTAGLTPVALPPGGSRVLARGWAPVVSAAQAGSSVAVGRIAGGTVAWEVVDLGAAAPGEVVGVAVSPDGSRLAAAFAATDPRRPYDVVTLDVASRERSIVRVDAELDGSPVWIDDRRVAVPTLGRGDVRTFTIIDVENGSQATQDTELADLTRSADGTRFATGAAIYGPRIFELADPAPALIATIGAVEGHGSAALDRTGTLLAVVLEDESGDATAIQLYAEAAGWNEEARFAIPGGAKRAFVTWLR